MISQNDSILDIQAFIGTVLVKTTNYKITYKVKWKQNLIQYNCNRKILNKDKYGTFGIDLNRFTIFSSYFILLQKIAFTA